MARDSQIKFLKQSFRDLVETLFVTRQISRKQRLTFEKVTRTPSQLRTLAVGLFGPDREIAIPGWGKLVLLSLKGPGTSRFNLLVWEGVNKYQRTKMRTCLVGHRFSKDIEKRFRWNLRHLFGLFGVKEDYSGFDGAAVNIIDDLRDKIRKYDFCLFDNRETTKPSKPNVYIEAGMAFALRKPFIFCHYQGEVWPSNFSNIFYVSYQNDRELFQKLYTSLPFFLRNKVKK